MHYHQHTDVIPCDADHAEWSGAERTILATLFHLEVQLMAQQDQLNTDVAAIGDALNSIASEIDGLKAQIAAQVPDSVDLSGLDALAQRARDLASQNAPAAPVADSSPGDASVDPAPATPDAAPADSGSTTDASSGQFDPTDVNPAPSL